MVCNTQNYGGFGFCPSSSVLKTREHKSFQNIVFFGFFRILDDGQSSGIQ
jgi:hypothetical protein